MFQQNLSVEYRLDPWWPQAQACIAQRRTKKNIWTLSIDLGCLVAVDQHDKTRTVMSYNQSTITQDRMVNKPGTALIGLTNYCVSIIHVCTLLLRKPMS